MTFLGHASLNRKIFQFRIGDHESIDSLMSRFLHTEIDYSDRHAAYQWCEDNIGDNWIWGALNKRTILFFLHKEDMVLFKLRFSTFNSIERFTDITT